MVLARSSAATIEEQAVKEGMMTLRHDGIRKVTGGVTTIEEVLRETTA
jgi:type IV pilus assembly protein PilB